MVKKLLGNKHMKIICAAIKIHDEDGSYIIRGHRHHDCIRTIANIPRYADKLKSSLAQNQGFINSDNEFVDRKEAFNIYYKDMLEKAEKELGRNYLLSEDLY